MTSLCKGLKVHGIIYEFTQDYAFFFFRLIKCLFVCAHISIKVVLVVQ